MSHQAKVTNFFASTKRGANLRNLKRKTESLHHKNVEVTGLTEKVNIKSKIETPELGTKTPSQDAYDLNLLDFQKSRETPKRKRNDSTAIQPNKRKRNSSDLSLEREAKKSLCPNETPPSIAEDKRDRKSLSIARKKLNLKETIEDEAITSEESSSRKMHLKEHEVVKAENVKNDLEQKNSSSAVKSVEDEKSLIENLVNKADITKLLSAHYSAPKPISPLPPSPQRKKNQEVLTKTALKDMASTRMAQIISKKMTNVEIKAKLGSCNKLAELKQQLESIAKLKAKKQSEAKPELQKFTSIEVTEAELEKSRKVPAYQKFHNLASVATPTLSLPYKYKLLEEFFRSVDSILSLLHNRKEICTFSKLKPAVQQLIRRTFETNHLGQIKQVFPDAYILKFEAGNSNFLQNSNRNSTQLTISPNFNYKSTAITEERVPNIELNSFQPLTPSILLERRNMFHNKLVELMKDHHSKFLAALDPPIFLPENKLKRWHPHFDVDAVPDIEPALLPQPTNMMLYNTAKDVLEKTRGLYGKRVESALENVAAKSVHEGNANISLKLTPLIHKGIPTSLLEKIRAKEAAKIEMEMIRDPAQDKKDQMRARLPDIIRILRNYFISEKKAAIVIEDAIQKLGESYRTSLSSDEIEEHIQLLAGLFPDWLSIISLKRGMFLKIDKNKDINSMCSKL